MLIRTWPLLLLAAAACGSEVGGGDDLPGVASPARNQAPAGSTAAPASRNEAAGAQAMPTATAAETAREVSVSPARAELATTVVLYSDLDAEVGSRMDGVVRSVLVELGDRVVAGQTLAVLDDEPQVARAASAKAAFELAAREHVRADELLKKGFTTPAQHDESSYRREAAEATLREAEIELKHTRILAPFAGVVTRRLTGLGRPVREAEPLFRITAMQPLRALARVPEAAARAIRPGMPALLTADGGDEVVAKVARISPAVDPGSGTVEVLLDVPRPGPLRPGSSAALLIPVSTGPAR
jgi:RND family efflux transporter MFP subunit